MLTFAVFILSVVCIKGQLPQRSCSGNRPYLLNDLGCANFEEVCFKKDDQQCNQFQNACKQCPPNNMTMIILQNILNRITELESRIKEGQSMVTNNTYWSELRFKEIIGVITRPSAIAITILVIIIILIIYAIFRKFFSYRKTLYKNVYVICAEQESPVLPSNTSTQATSDLGLEIPLLQKDKFPHKAREQNLIEIEKVLVPKIRKGWHTSCGKSQSLNTSCGKSKSLNTSCGKSKSYVEQEYPLLQRGTHIEDLIMQLQKTQTDFIMQLQNKPTDIKFATIQFQFDGMDQEPIELYVHNNHNILQVKQQICAKLPHAKHDDYKIMKLKYNGIILNDDNQYLLENIHQSNTIVNCFIDSSMNASDIVVVKLQGKMRLPDIIQIKKNQTIDQLKKLIGKIIGSQDFSLFKQSSGSLKTEELKDNLNELVDGDWIRIVTKEFGKLIIRSIFDDEDSITIEYVNADLVSSLMTSITNKFNWHLNNFLLFYNNKCLDANKYIFEYQISSESAVKYCCFMKWVGIKMDDDYITKGNFSELRYGTFINTNKKILIKKYEVKSSKNWKDEEFMLKELITFQITKSHRRFIQLLGVYIDDVILYVVMENMDGGTLKTFLQENYEKLDKNKIYKLSAQILEGLKFLHENKVIHRDLNPSSILVDGNNDLKLSSFNLSKYLDIYKPSSIMVKRDKKEELPVRYMAPELLNGDKYGEACDVWSFGTVLIRIATNKKPCSNSTKSEALNKISKKQTIEYKLPDKYSEFKLIIDSCLKPDPGDREKIEKLISNEYIGKYIS